MSLRLFNTLSGKVEDFHPIDDKRVRMYACGPTVYDYGHIGNFRTFIAVDLLYRFLCQSGYDVRYVMNITDVDDKIIRNAARDGVTVQQYTAKYTKAFFEDSALLNISPPTFVRATEHIEQMATFIGKLVEKGFAYRTDDGSYYFRIAKFPEYGKLSKKDFAGMNDGARVDVDEYDKDNARDFALWKAPKPGEASWETSIGPGRPGWHIECSVMSMEQLGPSFDLHAGGEDLIFPHHENEIAQSEALSGQQFARYWFHARFLLVEGQKMSKSLGNFYTLRDLVLKGHKPSSIRWLLTQVPYRNQLNFTFEGLKSAASSVEKLRNFRFRLERAAKDLAKGTDGNKANEKNADALPTGGSGANGKGTSLLVPSQDATNAALAAEGLSPASSTLAALARETAESVTAALSDDLNTAEAQGAIFDMLRKANTALDANESKPGEVRQDDIQSLLAVLDRFDSIFAVLKDDDQPKMKAVLDWARSEGREKDISPELEELAGSAQLADDQVNQKLAEMEAARKSRDFKQSDALRAELTTAGIIVENTKDGVRWRRK
ncbi:MAG: cysteine--tRNA ligase [Terriglobales bacterium]|jgi:cysteinyl-tRNA synthetase